MGKRANGEGSIYKQKDGRWFAALRMPDGKTKRYAGPRRSVVYRKLQEALRLRDAGLPLPADRLTVGKLLEGWLQAQKNSVRLLTWNGYVSKTKTHILPTLGRVRLSALTPQSVDAFLRDKLADGLSPRSVAHLRTILRAALNDAVRKGMLSRNAAALADPVRVEHKKVEPLSPTAAKAVLEAVSGHRLAASFGLAMMTGIRQGELLALKWEDIDLVKGTMQIRRSLQWTKMSGFVAGEPKTQRSRRTVVLPAPAIRALNEHKDRQEFERKGFKVDLGLVFCRTDGGYINGTNLTKLFYKLLADAALTRMRFHDLRHACASLLLAQGVNLRVVMEILGHSNISTTADLYSHVLPELQRDAADKMGAIWAETVVAEVG